MNSLATAFATQFKLDETDVKKFLKNYEGKTVKKEPVKDPNAPKRNKSPYLFFCEASREGIRKKHPDMKMTDVSKELGKMWKDLTEGEKGKYEKMAERDKVRYEKEMVVYKKT